MGTWIMLRRGSALAVAMLALFPPGPATADVSGPACQPACEGKECGDDGCGSLCGSCPALHDCQKGQCVFDGGCEATEQPGCGGCTCESCTCQLDPYCCTGKWDFVCVQRCSTQCGGCGKLLLCGNSECEGGETCATCPSDCGNCPSDCGPISGIGCCAGNTLLACEKGVLQVENCQLGGDDAGALGECGWLSPEGRYGCGGTGEDPAAKYPKACPTAPQEDVVQDVLLPASCQGVEFAGCCIAQVVFWCDGTGLHSHDCSGNPEPFDLCGWDEAKGYYDCGGSGSDPTGEHGYYCPNLDLDVTEDSPPPPECKVGDLVGVGCQSVPWEGCCSDGGALYFCEKGTLLCRLDCSVLMPPSNTCGWNSGQSGYYDCGGKGEDPLGEFPLACPPIIVEQDVSPQPDGAAPSACAETPDSGCCIGSQLHWCEDGHVEMFDCASLALDPVFHAYVHCGTNSASKKADCVKKPDPAPPTCGSGQPEPPPESAGDLPDVAGEGGQAPDSAGDGLGSDVASCDAEVCPSRADEAWAESSPFIVPGMDVVLETPGSKGDGGCSASVGSAGRGAGLVAALFGLLLALRVVSPRTFSRASRTRRRPAKRP